MPGQEKIMGGFGVGVAPTQANPPPPTHCEAHLFCGSHTDTALPRHKGTLVTMSDVHGVGPQSRSENKCDPPSLPQESKRRGVS